MPPVRLAMNSHRTHARHADVSNSLLLATTVKLVQLGRSLIAAPLPVLSAQLGRIAPTRWVLVSNVQLGNQPAATRLLVWLARLGSLPTQERACAACVGPGTIQTLEQRSARPVMWAKYPLWKMGHYSLLVKDVKSASMLLLKDCQRAQSVKKAL